jgi:hypothetical protein
VSKFSVKPAFSISINKAQGQTLNKVGLYLHPAAFSHGQVW